MLIANGISVADDDMDAIREKMNGWLLDFEAVSAAAPVGIVVKDPPINETPVYRRVAGLGLPFNPTYVIGATYTLRGGSLRMTEFKGVDERRMFKDEITAKFDGAATTTQASVFIALFDIIKSSASENRSVSIGSVSLPSVLGP